MERRVADITEFGYVDGKLDPAGIRHLCDHSLVGWSAGRLVDGRGCCASLRFTRGAGPVGGSE